MTPLAAGIVELVMRSFAAVYLAKHFGYIGICYAGPIAWIGASSVVFVGYIITIRRLSRGTSSLPNKWHNIRLCKYKQDCAPEGTPAE